MPRRVRLDAELVCQPLRCVEHELRPDLLAFDGERHRNLARELATRVGECYKRCFAHAYASPSAGALASRNMCVKLGS